MKAKIENDQQQMKRESQDQLEQQERRLQNIYDARLAMLREETEYQNETLQRKLSDIMCSLQNTLDAQQAQMEQLITELKHREGMWGQSIWDRQLYTITLMINSTI